MRACRGMWFLFLSTKKRERENMESQSYTCIFCSKVHTVLIGGNIRATTIESVGNSASGMRVAIMQTTSPGTRHPESKKCVSRVVLTSESICQKGFRSVLEAAMIEAIRLIPRRGTVSVRTSGNELCEVSVGYGARLRPEQYTFYWQVPLPFADSIDGCPLWGQMETADG
jgi:hypothetical protein